MPCKGNTSQHSVVNQQGASTAGSIVNMSSARCKILEVEATLRSSNVGELLRGQAVG